MTFYVELWCDGKLPDGRNASTDSPTCATMNVANPMVCETQVLRAGNMLRQQALAKGWRTWRQQRWFCPDCCQRGYNRTDPITGSEMAENARLAQQLNEAPISATATPPRAGERGRG